MTPHRVSVFGSLPCPKSCVSLVKTVSQPKLVFKCAYLFFYSIASGFAVAIWDIFLWQIVFVAGIMQKISSIILCILLNCNFLIHLDFGIAETFLFCLRGLEGTVSKLTARVMLQNC